MENQSITPDQLAQIRALNDFDLIMLLSEIHDNGWDQGAKLLKIMADNSEKKK